MNHLFVVVWNKGVTIYPSNVLQKYIGVKQDDHYPGRDPLQEMIEEAHKQGIKVHAWFEFGFPMATRIRLLPGSSGILNGWAGTAKANSCKKMVFIGGMPCIRVHNG